MLEIILATIAGIIIGIFTGLLPGIHINLVATITLTLTALITQNPLATVIFIAVLALTHTAIDFIPSIYLGAPEEDTFLSVLPGHELLKEGKGHEAIVHALYGFLIGVAAMIPLTLFFIFLAPQIQKIIYPMIAIIILLVSLYTIIREDNWKSAAITFILAGFLGYATFHTPMKEPLMPLLTGLFGVSGLLVSLGGKTKIPKQKTNPLNKIKIERKDLKNSILGTLIVAPTCSILPALGSGYACFISSEIWQQSRKGFLMINGSINALTMIASFMIVYTLEKSRTGAAAAIGKVLSTPTIKEAILIATVIIISSTIIFFIGIKISKFCARNITKAPYNKISIAIIIFLGIVTFLLSSWQGLIVLITGTSLGIFAIKSGIKRIHLMGSLLIPTLTYYLI